MLKEVNKITLNGIGFFLAFVILEVLVIIGFIMAIGARDAVMVVLMLITFVLLIVLLAGGLFRVEPNQAVALTLFGKYVGSTRTSGLRWTNPFLHPNKISLRIRNFESQWQPGRDRSRRRVEGRGFGRSAVRRGRLSGLRENPVRGGDPPNGLELSL